MGLGLSQFLTHNQNKGGRKFLNWKNDGEIVVWISTRASIAYTSWNHPFQARDVIKTKDEGTGREIEKEILRFNRFVSPDPEPVHEQQYFRDEQDRLKMPPQKDPFLLLREWLRHECQEPLDAVVFEWEDPKDGRTIQWKRGPLARLVDRAKSTWNHTLDTKLEYLFVVVDDNNPGEGPQIVRAPKLLGDKMKEAIQKEIDSNGESGNPLVEPYAFKWIFDKNAGSPMESYKAYRYNRAQLTNEIRDAITTDQFPDPEPDTRPRPGDKAKIRAAMEDVAQIDIPWDRIFVDAWEDEDPTDFDPDNLPPGPNETESKRTPEAGSESKPKAEGQPQPRRRKKKKAEPPKIPCDDCGTPMLPTATTCPNCGAEYEVDEDEVGNADSAGDSGGAPPASDSGSGSEKCWSCGGAVKDDHCTACGLDVTDNLPYA